MSKFVRVLLILLILAAGCAAGAVWFWLKKDKRIEASAAPQTPIVVANPVFVPVATDGFDYPVGKKRRVTQARDADDFYNAQDFGENRHLGEDWNGSAGGNTDCGAPVFAAARGVIVFAGNVAGWGNVLIIRHQLAGGEQVETLYGHLKEISKTSGEVSRRERIGTIGDGDGKYLCHLHFEIRTANCPAWGAAGGGYADDKNGWLDPSDFIDANDAK